MPKRYTTIDEIQSQFYQLPKFIMQGEYRNLSSDAKILYAMLKDRHSLSLSNRWINSNDEIYSIFSRQDMADMLGVSLPTAKKAITQLKNIGLVDEERQGLNKPNLIYLCKPLHLHGQKDSLHQEANILSTNKTDSNKGISKKVFKAHSVDTEVSDTLVFDEIPKRDSIFAKAEINYGEESCREALKIVDEYVDKHYPARLGRPHPKLNRAQRMSFATKILDCESETEIDNCNFDAMFRYMLDYADLSKCDPTIMYATTPQVMGYWLERKFTDVEFYDLLNTSYSPVESVY